MKDRHGNPMHRKTPAQATFVLILLLSLSVLAGCAGYQAAVMPEIPIPEARTCVFSTRQGGVVIGIDPFLEKDRLQTYFGANLMDEGILAVLVLIENESVEEGFVLDKASVCVLIDDQIIDVRPGLRNPIYREGPASATGRITSIAASPLLGLAYLAAFDPERQQRKTLRVANQMHHVEYTDKTLYPGISHHGMLYFKLEHPQDAARIQGFSAKGTLIRSGKSVEFVIRRMK